MQYRLANVTPFVKLVWVALAAGLTCLPVTAAGQVRGDFNGDGFDDLALGVPGEDVRDAAFNNIMDAGAVSVIYGSPVGLSATSVPNQFWHQGSDGVPDLDEALDGFGSSLAAGDFNADGFDDLAIGVPGEDVGIVVDAGAVTVLYGSVFGLTSVGSQTWHQNSSGILGVSRRNDQFGFALAAGDFDDDGYEDLAAGIPFKVVGGKANVGAISVLHGSVNGISARDQYLENDNLAHDANSRYGFALAVGKFSGDGTDDLAIGAPGDDRGGAVYFVEGRLVGGLARSFHTIQSRDLDDRGAGDEFGFALAAGDFNGDSRADVAVGVPNTSSGGMLEIIYFTLEGVSRCVVRGTTCHVTHLLTDPVVGDAFGFALAVGNFNQSGGDDIAVSAPTREVGNIADAGVVAILYSRPDFGLTTAVRQLWTQNTSGIADAAESSDTFGASLAAGDFNGDDRVDLAIGVPGEDLFSPIVFRTMTDAGAVHVVYGAATGVLAASRSQLWHQDSADINDGAESGDRLSGTR